MPKTKQDAKAKLLDAALSVIRTKGFSATTVDELCSAAGVTKGAFFHHFKSKDELGVAVGRTRPGHCLPTRLITIMPIRSIASSAISSSANLFCKAACRSSLPRRHHGPGDL